MSSTIDETLIIPKEKVIIKELLKDRTTKDNILWATDNYAYLGDKYAANHTIQFSLISGKNTNIIKPRLAMSKNRQTIRTKNQAEVQTPAWMCNIQNNLIDDFWFNKPNTFNYVTEKNWTTNKESVEFTNKIGKCWTDYVDSKRLEIACGEAPYITSRYDMETGINIALQDRIGILDRKLRVVNENSRDKTEWLMWAFRALESTYGYEFQGDRLFIARVNIFNTFCENLEVSLNRQPSSAEIERALNIIVWNIWQMDGLTYAIPYDFVKEQPTQISIFELQDMRSPDYCRIRDWRNEEEFTYKSLIEGR